jgi:hypothetical protein
MIDRHLTLNLKLCHSMVSQNTMFRHRCSTKILSRSAENFTFMLCFNFTFTLCFNFTFMLCLLMFSLALTVCVFVHGHVPWMCTYSSVKTTLVNKKANQFTSRQWPVANNDYCSSSVREKEINFYYKQWSKWTELPVMFKLRILFNIVH